MLVHGNFCVAIISNCYSWISFYGKDGWLAHIFQFLGLDYDYQLYGWAYILIAHVFFNLPLVIKLVYDALSTIPDTQRKLAAQLDMTVCQEFCYVQWFYIRRQLLSTFLLNDHLMLIKD